VASRQASNSAMASEKKYLCFEDRGAFCQESTASASEGQLTDIRHHAAAWCSLWQAPRPWAGPRARTAFRSHSARASSCRAQAPRSFLAIRSCLTPLRGPQPLGTGAGAGAGWAGLLGATRQPALRYPRADSSAHSLLSNPYNGLDRPLRPSCLFRDSRTASPPTIPRD